MRGFKNVDSPIFKGYQIYDNYILPHQGFGGDTPADRVGIKVEGQNKWLRLSRTRVMFRGRQTLG